MTIRTLHRWPRTPRAAITLQRRLAAEVRQTPLTGRVRYVAGADVAFTPDGRFVIAGVVVWDGHTRDAVEQHVARAPTRFPYVPGLLSFREIPALLGAFRKLEQTPDVVLCDGQGIAHPRRCGLASHLGLWLDLPTVGCAKSRLCGDHAEPAARRGGRADLLLDGAVVGAVLRTRDDVRPLYVSPGHRCDLASAVRLTLACCTRFRLPEPARLAHQLVTRARLRPSGPIQSAQ
jgi:deoxyribonuclease V